MTGEQLYCVDCYVPNQEALGEKCLGRCDGNGPVDTAEGIERFRKLRARISPEGAHCSECNRGLLGYPNDWWRNELKLLRCDWCHAEYRVAANSPIILSRTKRNGIDMT